MQPLQAVLKCFVGVGTLSVLKLHHIVVLLFNFVNQFANEQCNQTVKSILFVTHIIVSQNLLETVYNFIVRVEIFQIAFT